MELGGVTAEEAAAALHISTSAYYYRMRDPEKRFSYNDLRILSKKCNEDICNLVST